MKIIAIGRNYAEHAKELNNPVPTVPVIFMKPDTALLKDNKPFYLPDFSDDVHYELEVVLKVCKEGKHIAEKFAAGYYDEIGLGIDFTARDIQTKHKEKGLPWELAKGFDSYENQLYAQFLALISKNYKTSREVADYARLLGISARKLTDLSKRCSDRGAKELINGQIIAEAKRSLQFTSNPIKEIAFELNFVTPDQFSHFFKKNTQVSPNDYRSLFLNIGI